MSALQQKATPELRGLRPEKDRRRHHRVELRLGGRFLNDVSEDHGLLTENISCNGAALISTQKPMTGAPIVCYIDGLGRVAATVIRRTDTGFAVRFNTTQHKRDKLADKLVWLVNKEKLNLTDERASPRYATEGPALITRQDGRTIQCRAIDISLTGAGFETDGPAPMLGEIVTVGHLRGEVVRRNKGRFGIRYIMDSKD